MDPEENNSNLNTGNNNNKKSDGHEKEGKMPAFQEMLEGKEGVNNISEESDTDKGVSSVNSDGKSDAIANNTPPDKGGMEDTSKEEKTKETTSGGGDMGGGDIKPDPVTMPKVDVKPLENGQVDEVQREKNRKTEDAEDKLMGISTDKATTEKATTEKTTTEKPLDTPMDNQEDKVETTKEKVQNGSMENSESETEIKPIDQNNKTDQPPVNTAKPEENSTLPKEGEPSAQEKAETYVKKFLEVTPVAKKEDTLPVDTNTANNTADPAKKEDKKNSTQNPVTEQTTTPQDSVNQPNSETTQKTPALNKETKTEPKKTEPAKTEVAKTETTETKPAETPEEIARKKGREKGLLLGRSIGMGMILEEEMVGTAVTYKKTPFQEYFDADPSKTAQKDGKQPETLDGKIQAFIANEDTNAKTAYEGGESEQKSYYDGYISGYNIGYNEGITYKAEEEKAAQQKTQQDRIAKPEYILGLELGKYAGMLAVAGKTEFALKASNGVEYKTTLADVRAKEEAGQDPAGTQFKKSVAATVEGAVEAEGKIEEESEASNYKTAFTIGYNAAYQEALTAKNKQPSHQDKLADPDFRTGYLLGNELGRNQNLDPNRKKQLQDLDAQYTGKDSDEKAKTDGMKNDSPEYAAALKFSKERSGFIYGFNSAYYQLQGEAKAKAKALQERKGKDPAYLLGKTAGTIKGILASVFGEVGITAELFANPKKITDAGISFVVPPNIQTVILTDSIDKAILVDPDKEQDPTKKAALETKKAEQLAFFREAYQRTFVDGYKKGQNDKLVFEQNKYRNDPGYQAALKPILEVKEGSASSSEKGEITLKLNAGALKAYTEHKLKNIPDDDSKRSEWEKILADTTKLREEGTEIEEDKDGKKVEVKKTRSDSYKRGYDECYNYFVSKLNNPKDPVNIAIKNKIAQEQYGGRTESEKEYYSYGEALANEQIKAQDAAKAKGLPQSQVDANFLGAENKIKCDLADKIAANSIPNNTLKFVATNQSELDAEIQKIQDSATSKIDAASKLTPDPTPDVTANANATLAAIKSIKKAWTFFTNGYNSVFYAKFHAGVKSDKGNNAAKMKKFEETSFKGPISKEKLTITGIKIEFKEQSVNNILKNKKDKALELFKLGAEEGFTKGYQSFIKPENGGIKGNKLTTKTADIVPTSEVETRFNDKNKELEKEYTEATAKESNLKTAAEYANGLLYFFAIGYNFGPAINDDADFGLIKGMRQGKSYAEGYVDAPYTEKGSKDAYEAGKTAKVSVQGYNSFKASMNLSKSKDNAQDLDAVLAKQELDSSKHYQEGKNRDLNLWNLVIQLNDGIAAKPEQVHLLKNEITFAKAGTFDLEKGEVETEFLAVGKYFKQIILNSPQYVERATEFYKSQIWQDCQTTAKAELEAELKAKKEADPANSADLKVNPEDITKRMIEKITPLAENFKKGYEEKLSGVKAGAMEQAKSAIFYAHGYKDGYAQARPNKTLPPELQIVEDKSEDDKNKQGVDIILDKNHVQYKLGYVDGSDLGRKIELGFLSEEDITTEYQKKKPKALDADGKVVENAYGETDYAKGKKDGKKSGLDAAKTPDFNKELPNPEEFNKLKEDTNSTDNSQTKPEKKKENNAGGDMSGDMSGGMSDNTSNDMGNNMSDPQTMDSSLNHSGGMDSLEKPAITTENPSVEKKEEKKLSKLYKDGFSNAYWKAKDAKGGEIEGLKAVINQDNKKSGFKISNYYTPIQNDQSSKDVDPKIRAIKDINIFENSFINAKEAAEANENPQNLLKETTKLDLDKNYTEGLADGKKVGRLAAKSPQPNNEIPNPEKYHESKKDKPTKIVSGGMDSGESTPTTQTKKPLSEHYKKGFIESFWKAKDARLGEITGIKSLIGNASKPVETYYVVIENDADSNAISDKIAIKNKDIFETSFAKGKENAQKSGNPEQFLETTINPTDQQKDAKKRQKFIQSVAQKAQGLAAKMAERYAHYQIAKETRTNATIGGKEVFAGKIDKIIAIKQKQKAKEEEVKKVDKLLSEKELIIQKFADARHKKSETKTETKPEIEIGDPPQKTVITHELKKDAEAQKPLLLKKRELLDADIKSFNEILAPHKSFIDKIEWEKEKEIDVEKDGKKTKEIVKETVLQTPEEALAELTIFTTTTGGKRTELDAKLAAWLNSSESNLKKVQDGEENQEEEEYEDEDETITAPTTDEAQKETKVEEKKELSFSDLTQDEKNNIYLSYDSEYDSKKKECYYTALAETTKDNFFDDSLGNALNMLGDGSFTSGDHVVKNEESDSEVIKSIQDAYHNATTDDGLDILLDNMPIVSDFATLEAKMREVHSAIPAKQLKVTDAEFEIFGWEQQLLKEKQGLTGKKELEEKIATLSQKKEANTISPEEEIQLTKAQSELAKFTPAATKVQNIEETIKNLETNIKTAREDIDFEVEKIRLFLTNNLKLALPNKQKTNETILDYVNHFDKKLLLKTSFNYVQSPIKIKGGGDFLVHENAEDIRIDANFIKIKKGQYEFQSKGFEYIEDKEYINLFKGTAVVPRLEGDASANNEKLYHFQDVGLQLSKGVRGQLKYQQSKLVAGEITQSTGGRNKGVQTDIDPKAPQNLKPKE